MLQVVPQPKFSKCFIDRLQSSVPKFLIQLCEPKFCSLSCAFETRSGQWKHTQRLSKCCVDITSYHIYHTFQNWLPLWICHRYQYIFRISHSLNPRALSFPCPFYRSPPLLGMKSPLAQATELMKFCLWGWNFPSQSVGNLFSQLIGGVN